MDFKYILTILLPISSSFYYMMYNHHNNYEAYRKGDKWLEFEDDALLFELQNNLTIDEIAYKHRRTKGAINSRRNQIALMMYENYSTIDEIINTTKLSKKNFDLILKHKKVQMNMKNGSWNKPITPDKKVMTEEEKELIQNMKDELFMMENGYWLKVTDELEDLDYQYELKKFKQIEKKHPKEFNYVSKSKYPKIIMKELNDPPEFPNNLNSNHQAGHNILTIVDKIDNNHINYMFMNYQQPKHSGEQYIKGAYNEQLKIKIKSLKSIIKMFEMN